MTIAQLRARELLMESSKGISTFKKTNVWDDVAKYRASVVRENERAIEAAVNDALAEAAK